MTTQGSQVLHLLLITLCPLRYCSHDYLFKVEAQQRRAPIKVEMIAFFRFSPSISIYFEASLHYVVSLVCWTWSWSLPLYLCTYFTITITTNYFFTTISTTTTPLQSSSVSLDRQQCTISTRGRRTKEPTQTLKPRRSLSCSTSPCCFRFPFLHNNFKGIRCQSLIHCYCLSRRVQWVLVVPWRTSQVQDLKTSRPLRFDFRSTPLFQS